MHPKDAEGIANSVDTDETARSSPIWVCAVFPDLSVRKLRNLCDITVVSINIAQTKSYFDIIFAHFIFS